MNAPNPHMAALDQELYWLNEVIKYQFEVYFNTESPPTTPVQEALPPPPHDPSTHWGQLLHTHQPAWPQRLALALALAPQLKPQLLDNFFTKNAEYDRPFAEFGGHAGTHHNGFLPTGQTLGFLLNPCYSSGYAQAIQALDSTQPLLQKRILTLAPAPETEPPLSGALTISNAWLNHLLTGQEVSLQHDALFPATRISTPLNWQDLVLQEQVRKEIDHIHLWLQKGQYLLEDLGLKKHLKPGYRCLFYGPPGTGKTLTACLLGKSTGKEVYRVDLSMMVSKYIGETQKNLKRVFDYAERQEWILFFDEADALFGKRTQTKSSNDRHANQEVAYLLQRIEDFPGLVILASNLRSNMDEAFTRRFQSIVYFPMPNAQSRLQIWQGIFAGAMKPAPNLDLPQIAQSYELAGGSAINVFQYGALKAAGKNQSTIEQQDLLEGIARELHKEGKTLAKEL